MATLVLGAVGTALGGPVGGALGAAVGRAADARLLAPRRRQGPRLSELAVQLSSYGAQIPKLFGAVRVAGVVIWATDLREHRGSGGGGKGQAATAAYSYTASFAVLLSGRPVLAVRRVWADGALVRGAAGDWKVRTGFRLHLGGEDQPPDPLIAAAEGGDTPAYRGCAYVVFEDLALAQFGNRIPQLTFEVVADEGPVAAGAVAAALSAEAGGDARLALDGFAAAGGSVGAVLEVLAEAAGVAPTVRGGRVRLDEPGAARALVDDGVSASGAPVRLRALAPADTVPRAVTVRHYDPQRDYQAGVQRATRPGPGWREEAVELPACLAAGAARGVAERALAALEAARERRTVSLGPHAMDVAPGDAVVLDGRRWRVAAAGVERMAVVLELTPEAARPAAAPADGGRVLGSPDLEVGRTVLHAAELPPLDDAVLAGPRLTVAAAGGPGWRPTPLLYSLDDGASWVAAGLSAAPAVMGAVAVAAGPGSAALLDERNIMEVALAADATLGDADGPALAAGANLALAGDELVQWARAAPVGGGRWRLSGLLRGRRGTPVGGGRAGDRFVVLEAGAARALDLPAAALGRTVRVMAQGPGDAAPTEARAVLSGASALPPAPVGLRVEGDAVRWIRSSRAGWAWLDGADAPLAEEAERYLVSVARADGAVRTAEVGGPALALEPAERAGAVVTVRQRGTLGLGPATKMVIGGGSA